MATISNNANPALSGHLNFRETKQAKQLAAVLKEFIAVRRESEAKETQLKIQLKDILKPAYFGYNEGAQEASDVTHAFDVDDLQVNFTNSYFIKDNQHLQTLVKLLGAGHPLADTFKESQKITVDVTELSPQDAKDLAVRITNAAVAYSISPKVERKAIATQKFHDLRHVYLSAEDNIELDKALPLVIQVAPIE